MSKAMEIMTDMSSKHLDVPELHPFFFPFKTQYKILSLLQSILEECCFEFGNLWLPQTTDKQGWHEVESVELTQWIKVFLLYKKDLPPNAISLDCSKNIDDVLTAACKIRHSAVRRIPTTALDILSMLSDATYFAEAFNDVKRAQKLIDWKIMLRKSVFEIAMHQSKLKKRIRADFDKIAHRRSELAEIERLLVERMLVNDEEHRNEIGKAIERSLIQFQCFSPNERGTNMKMNEVTRTSDRGTSLTPSLCTLDNGAVTNCAKGFTGRNGNVLEVKKENILHFFAKGSLCEFGLERPEYLEEKSEIVPKTRIFNQEGKEVADSELDCPPSNTKEETAEETAEANHGSFRKPRGCSTDEASPFHDKEIVSNIPALSAHGTFDQSDSRQSPIPSEIFPSPGVSAVEAESNIETSIATIKDGSSDYPILLRIVDGDTSLTYHTSVKDCTRRAVLKEAIALYPQAVRHYCLDGSRKSRRFILQCIKVREAVFKLSAGNVVPDDISGYFDAAGNTPIPECTVVVED